ncbi:DDHD domain-containing protein [Globomyces pollinis-pini]|nr:DDHD domain-containing protein [Globomyces pollinis-pini]
MAMENRYQERKSNQLLSNVITPIQHDTLYEVNVESHEFYPIYWDGATYEVRRGIWFEPKGPGGAYIPCDDNLTRQINDGYKKYIAAQKSNQSTTSLTNESNASQKQENRWALFGPYMNQFVVYSSDTVAYIQTDELTSKFQRAVLKSTGTKLIRGWKEVEKLKKQAKKENKENIPVKDSTNQKDISSAVSDPPLSPVEDKKLQEVPSIETLSNESKNQTPREINHLIFAIHGIGQKLSEHIEAMSFPNDCDIFRNSIMSSSVQLNAQLKALNHPQKDVIPDKGGVQVLPIQWRQNMRFGIDPTDEDDDLDRPLDLDDILPEGIPGIRMLVSDVIVDVLLYMTPKFRKEMIKHVSSELNRVYRLYKSKNPHFNGTVSIYGHSLGSVLGYDIAVHQGVTNPVEKTEAGRNSIEVDISDLLGSKNMSLGPILESSITIDAEPLDFSIDHLYTVGSPVGMFFLLGNHCLRPPIERDVLEPSTKHTSSRPHVRQLYNIYHPYDPVAHRLEPLYSSGLSSLKPMPIVYTKGGLTQTVKGIEQAGSAFLERSSSLLYGFVSSAGTMMSSFSKIVPAPPPLEVEMSDLDTRRASISSNKSNEPPIKLRAKPSSLANPTAKQKEVIERLKCLNENGRLDFVLQESVLENPYLSSLGVHMNYWNDSDVNALVLRSLYGIMLESNTTSAKPTTVPDSNLQIN